MHSQGGVGWGKIVSAFANRNAPGQAINNSQGNGGGQGNANGGGKNG